MHYISSEAKYQYVCHCSVYCIDSVDAVRTDYNHTNPSISAFIRHFSRKLERITITICGKGSQTAENEDNSVLVRTWKWRWKSTWKSFVFPPDLKKFLLFCPIFFHIIFLKNFQLFLSKEIVISMGRSCNLRQVDILLMTCLLSLTGHYWVKGDDGWETSIQTILHPHKVSTNIIYIFDATFIFWWIVFWVFFVTTHFCPFWMKYLTSPFEI